MCCSVSLSVTQLDQQHTVDIVRPASPSWAGTLRDWATSCTIYKGSPARARPEVLK